MTGSKLNQRRVPPALRRQNFMVKEKKRLKSAAHVSSISLYQEPVDEENTVI
jgi:hypothetical protein